MAVLRADRYLHVTRDRSRVVEEDDVRGAWLLVSPGSVIGEGDVQRYGMYMEGGRVRYEGCPPLPGDEPAAKQAARPEDKQAAPPENKSFGGGEDADADEEPEAEEADEEVDAGEWPLSTPPDAYLERFPDGPNAELARQILAAPAEDESGGS